MERSELLNALLETLKATAGVMPWGVAAIHSQRCVVLWDCQPDAVLAIMAAIGSDCGGIVVAESSLPLTGGRTLLGIVLETTGDDLEDFAADVRTAYLCATGADPTTLENPF